MCVLLSNSAISGCFLLATSRKKSLNLLNIGGVIFFFQDQASIPHGNPMFFVVSCWLSVFAQKTQGIVCVQVTVCFMESLGVSSQRSSQWPRPALKPDF